MSVNHCFNNTFHIVSKFFYADRIHNGTLIHRVPALAGIASLEK
jgi:hypothetical protein